MPMFKVLSAVRHDRLGLVMLVPLNVAVISLPFLLLDVEPGFFHHPAILGFYLMVSAFVAVEVLSSAHANQLPEPSGHHPWLPYVTGMALLVFFWMDLLGAREVTVTWAWWHAVAIPVVLAGVGLRVLAIRTLKQHFVSHLALRHDHHLVQHGVYRWLRHPSELGLILVCVGLLLWLSVPAALGFMLLAILPLSLFRIYQEEALLAERFAMRFERYRSRTSALLPGLF